MEDLFSKKSHAVNIYIMMYEIVTLLGPDLRGIFLTVNINSS